MYIPMKKITDYVTTVFYHVHVMGVNLHVRIYLVLFNSIVTIGYQELPQLLRISLTILKAFAKH